MFDSKSENRDRAVEAVESVSVGIPYVLRVGGRLRVRPREPLPSSTSSPPPATQCKGVGASCEGPEPMARVGASV